MFTAANHPHSPRIPWIRSKAAASPELLLCGSNSREDASTKNTILVSSNTVSTDIYAIRPYNVHYLLPHFTLPYNNLAQ